MNSCYFQTHDLGMAMGAEVVGAPGPFCLYYSTSPLEAGEVIVLVRIGNSWGVLLGKISPSVKSEWLWG